MSDTLFCSICREPYKDCSCPAKGLASLLQTLDSLRAQDAPKPPSEVKSTRYSQCNDAKKAIVDALVKEEILTLQEDRVNFSEKFQDFMAYRFEG